ncbi:MAG: pectate lyase [Bacteroidales bacterium]|nr:pectate lyase [Bacteroidales bacterium]
MKSFLLVCLALMVLNANEICASNAYPEKTPAFPGAEGYGRYVSGGRGGKVYHVTNLNDSGEGSFRWACEQKGARTIVFDVCGTIHLQSQLKLTNGDVTIAGQTAPGDGICVADWDFCIAAPNVIIRYMRFRPGDVSGGEPDGLSGMDGKRIIIDHCSVSWSVDECLSVYGNEHMTVQWCIISQSLRHSTHSKQAHGYGGNWGGKGASYHHNLLAHHDSRTPRLGNRPTYVQQDTTDIRNNVMYNWSGNGCYGGEGMKVNFVNNYYKPGPATDARATGSRQPLAYRICGLGVSTKENDGSYLIWGKYFVDGNDNPDYPSLLNKNWEMGIYPQISSENPGYTAATKDSIRLSEPLPYMYVSTHTAADAYEKVLAYAGCSRSRDKLDSLIVSDTRLRKASFTGKGEGDLPGIIDTPYDLKPAHADADWSPWPELKQTRSYKDADGDGMDDDWEISQHLNPQDASDGLLLDDNGYTMLEVYLNSLVADITEAQNQGAVASGYIEYDNPNENVVSIPASKIDLDKAEIIMASDGKNKAVIKGDKADSFSHNDVLRFELCNTQSAAFTMSFIASTKRDDFKLNISFGDLASGASQISKTLSISNTGDWEKYKEYQVDLGELPAGNWLMDIKFLSSRGQYTGNLQKLSIMKTQQDALPSVKLSHQKEASTIYRLDGRQVNAPMESLPAGIYLIEQQKILIK